MDRGRDQVREGMWPQEQEMWAQEQEEWHNLKSKAVPFIYLAAILQRRLLTNCWKPGDVVFSKEVV